MFYLKKFDNHNDYEAFINGGGGKVYLPNTSLCINENDIHYKPQPYDAEVEYLYCSESPYIDTGIILASDTEKISTEFCIITKVPAQVSEAIIISYPNAGVQVYVNSSIVYNQSAAVAVSNNTKYTFETITTSTKRQIRIKDSAWKNQDFNRSISDNMPIYIFGAPTLKSLTSPLCWIKIYKNDILVRDYIPVRVGTTGYMYDKVSGQLFGNAGTGNFILGPDV